MNASAIPGTQNLFTVMGQRFCWLLFCLVFGLPLFFADSTFAQTVGTSNLVCDISKRNPCTSKDLEIVSVEIDAPACTSCTPGETVTYPLKMTIHNGTKSVRTAFALYGSLSSGASINGISGNIFVCVGPITVKSDEDLGYGLGNQQFAAGTITFTCGQDLTLSENFLVWTDASGTTADRCNTFSQATKCADIAPKCGTANSIEIKGPVVPPTLDKVDPTCTVSTGKVLITSSTTGFTFSLDNGAFETYPTGGWTVNSGQHCVRSKRISDGCISQPECITISGAPANPDRPVVTLQEATICGTLTAPTITVSCPIAGTYTLTQTGVAGSQTKTYPENNPVVFTVQAGKQFSITVTNTAGCTSAATNCTNHTSNSCPAVNTQKAMPKEQSVIAESSIITAAPNPFSDKIRFTITPATSGRGTLELYNMLGQKVKTVFQGQVQKGQTQTIEYSVPYLQRDLLLYQFNVGKERISGKLLGLKRLQ